MIVKVLINTSIPKLNKVYDYLVPKELEEKIEIGKRVEVNFGNNRKLNEEGIIVKIENEDYTTNYKLKNIIDILDDISYINESRLKLAKYIAHTYFCNVYSVLKLMLPPGTSSKNSKKSLDTKKDTVISLLKSGEDIFQDIENDVITSSKQIQLLTFLVYNDLVLLNDVVNGLGISRSVISNVEKKGYIKLDKVEKQVDILENVKVEKSYPKIPTDEQKRAIEGIGKYIDEGIYKECLLYGVTGSGKTEVYLQLIEKVLQKRKKAIILVPEISLTYQTVVRFVSRFGNDIAVLHSKMTISKRKQEYKRIKEGKVNIVIGARSAIFAPIENLGIVVMDEEHDQSYYSATTPKYSTKEVARYICNQENAVLLLASATPEVVTYNRAVEGKTKLYTINNRPGRAILPKIELVDLKEDRLLGNTSIFSNKLKDEILENIKRKEQTMIFLNRRGYNSYVTCKDCGFIFKCPNCDVALVYHKQNNLLICHYCSHVEKNIKVCHKCGGNNITSGTFGTQKIEDELKNIYPEITTLRMDADTTIARDSHQKILDKFKNENINVLIGTQMISKGHDIPNVTLVGILGVDSMIAMNDFCASERAFSNIYQVSRKSWKGR